MPAAAEPPQARSFVEALAGPGFAVDPTFADPDLVRGLVADIERRDAAGGFRAAAVGAGPNRAVRPQIRGDRICWLMAAESAAERAILARLEALRVLLNRTLMLGLVDLECHYAIYAPGARYARHLDRSPQGAERVVSIVLYLNAAWQASDGGELVIAAEAGEAVIAPAGGTLAAFLSQRLEHEVRVAQRARLSLTGWFRRRPASGIPL
jgi:SM-20-related protein